MTYGFFDTTELDKVSAEGFIRDHDFSKIQSEVSGKGIDDMTDEEKFEEGKKGLGGSEISDLFGLGFHGTSGPSVVFDKKFRTKPEELSEITKRRFAQGHFSETQIFAMIQEVLPEGWKAVLDKNRYKDVDRSFCHADIDLLLISPDGEKFVGEIKSYSPYLTRPVSGVFGQGGTLPHDGYIWQVRYYMHEFNTRAAVVFSAPMAEFDSSKMTITVVYRDFKKEELMMDTIDNFWLNHVQKGKRPEITSLTDEALESAKEISVKPSIEGNTISLPSECCKLVEEINNLDIEKSELKKQQAEENKIIDERKNALILALLEAMGSAQIGSVETPDGAYTVTRTFKTSSKFDKKSFGKEYPELLKKFTLIKEDEEESVSIKKNK